jgi:hypothetical protein
MTNANTRAHDLQVLFVLWSCSFTNNALGRKIISFRQFYKAHKKLKETSQIGATQL